MLNGDVRHATEVLYDLFVNNRHRQQGTCVDTLCSLTRYLRTGLFNQLLKLLGKSFLTYQVSVIYRFHMTATISEIGLAVFESSR